MQSLDNVFWYRLERSKVVYDTLTYSEGSYVTTCKRLRGDKNRALWNNDDFKKEVNAAQDREFYSLGLDAVVDGNIIRTWGGAGTAAHLKSSGTEGDGGSLFLSGCVGCEDRWKLFNSTFAAPWVGANDGVIKLMVKVPGDSLRYLPGGDTLVSADIICRGERNNLPGAIPWSWVVKMRWWRKDLNDKKERQYREIEGGILGKTPQEAIDILRKIQWE